MSSHPHLTFSCSACTLQVLTADGVPLRLDAVVFYRVMDPCLWVMCVKDGHVATHTLAQTTLRGALGAHTLRDILTKRRHIAERLEVSEMIMHTAAESLNKPKGHF